MNFRSNDIDMLHNMQLSYFVYQMYQKFLSTAEKILELYESDLITHMNFVKYYIDINQNLKKAKEFIDKALSIIELNRNLYHFKAFFLEYNAKTYFLQNDFDSAKIYALKCWIEFNERSPEVFILIVDILKKQEEWEELEDFCLNAYRENEFDPNILEQLHFAHLKRKSHKKAESIYEQVSYLFPELLPLLDKMKKNSNNS